LRFRNARLVDVIGDFNTYYQHPIRIESESLSGERISGSFDPMNPQALLEYVRNVYGARVTQAQDGSTRITGPTTNLAAAQVQ
jgi:ferric-dicitrate binding protein FerR (iron transport regulator)